MSHSNNILNTCFVNKKQAHLLFEKVNAVQQLIGDFI